MRFGITLGESKMAKSQPNAPEADVGRFATEDAPVLLKEQVPYETFATRLTDTCLVGDPWWDGDPIYSSAPLILTPAMKDEIFRAGKEVGVLYEEMAQIVRKTPELLDSFFHFLPFYKLMWLSSDGWWHGFARMDMFHLKDGSLKICELNADTPSGQVETLVPAGLVAPDFPSLEDPNAHYQERFWNLLCRVHQARTGNAQPKRVGILYPTDLSEDITLIRLYQKWIEEKGIEAPLGSPMNLQATADGGVALFGQPVDLIVRHYKTDWWGERPFIWTDDEDITDPDPLERELMLILEAERSGKVTVVNPFGALLAQSKIALAFFWEEMERFSEEGQKRIRALIPETYRLDTIGRERAKREKDTWVLKSDFGCEGDEVVIGKAHTQEEWERVLDVTMEHTWVLQKYFEIRPLPTGQLPNYGVYLIAGEPSGLLVRLQDAGAEQDLTARVVVPLVGDVPEGAERA